MTEDNIYQQYRGGKLLGYTPDPKADAAFDTFLRRNGYYANAGDAVDDYHLAEVGKDVVSLPYLAAMSMYPGCLGRQWQKRGSCVAWSTRNALMVSYCAYLKYGDNAEKFAAPTLSQTAIDNGAFSTEGIYWFRRHGSDGWQCSAAAQVATEECGLLERRNYQEIGIDLTQYDPRTEGRWGASLPPQNVRDLCNDHISGNATVCKTWEQVRSMVASGYALSTCGMEAFKFQRDEYGLCKRDHFDSWAHAMAVIGVDDRPEVRQRYSSGLVLVQNSWPPEMVTGPDVVAGTSKRIPPCSFWARWEDFKNRYIVALGPSKGWTPAKMPNWGGEEIL
jgi:hypothetical protein